MGRLLNERVKDRCAEAVIRLAGGLVVVLVVAIFVGIAVAALPLFRGARLAPATEIATDLPVAAVGWDVRGPNPWWLDGGGTELTSGNHRLDLAPPWTAPPTAWSSARSGLKALIDRRGTVHVGVLQVSRRPDAAVGGPSARWRPAADPLPLPADGGWRGIAAGADLDGGIAIVAWGASSTSAYRWDDPPGRWRSTELPWTGSVAAVAVSDELGFSAAVDSRGDLTVVNLRTGELEEVGPLEVSVRLVRFVGESLVAAAADGSVSVLLRVPQAVVRNGSGRAIVEGALRLEPGQRRVLPYDRQVEELIHRQGVEIVPAPPTWHVVRRLARFDDLPTVVAASPYDRSFAVGGERGTLALYHATSGRRLLQTVYGGGPLRAVVFSERGDRLAAASEDAVYVAELHNPHPEISLHTLFRPVWYEGYAEPRLIWQSSGGSDDFEPKLSLWPLILGTFKATVYAMLISVPLALLAAIYISQLAPRWLQVFVKPTVELMAAVPTVVVGFLAALWLAPLLEASLFQSLFSVALLPLVVILAVLLWRLLPLSIRGRAPDGSELVLLAVVAGTVLAGGWRLASGVEALLFAGDFPRWLFTEWGQRYDQRNAIVVGIALGFAVIPVIFTIAEDACSSVPRSLTRAARALGATRWQAAIRMVVPAASPGLFAAVMLGLGRAIGETMIVLMASGNTPLLDLGPFDGMRTMAAAIAFEIPEAAVGSTLYRVLFLAGLLLFVLTFVISTLADLVGRALRRRYAPF